MLRKEDWTMIQAQLERGVYDVAQRRASARPLERLIGLYVKLVIKR